MAEGTDRPARRRTDLAASLSKARRLASKLEPVYGISRSSRIDATVPSSPNLPWRARKATS
jgi:hypothetical protein